MSTTGYEPDGRSEAVESPFATEEAEGVESWAEPSLEDRAASPFAEADAAHHPPQDAEADLVPSVWQPMVRIAMGGGLRDRNGLTNLVFFARHPERKGRKLEPDEPDYRSLSTEWLRIRDAIVAPVLDRTAGSVAPSGTGATGPLEVVGTALASGATANRYGISETIEALEWIQREWARRHPEVRFGVSDISRRGGGRLGRHKSHRAGLDADVNLVVNGRRIEVDTPGYEGHRPLVQELVGVIRSNPVLPVKTIGFLDPKVSDVAQWKGHTKHLHVRFCRPARYAASLDLGRVYAKGEHRADYDCAAARELESREGETYGDAEDVEGEEYDEYEDDEYERYERGLHDEHEGGEHEQDEVDDEVDEDEVDGSEGASASPLAAEDPVTDTIASLAVDQLELPQDEAEGFLEPFRRFAQPFQHAIAVVRALQAGRRDEDDLTDLVYFERFPAHRGRRPTPGQPGFTQWSEIRVTLVRPLLWGHIRIEARRIALVEWEWWRRGRRLEDEAGAVQDRLTDYWAVTPHTPTGDAIWQGSWSAAFISWVLREAGTGTNFLYHNAHRVFVHWAVRNAVDGTTHPVKAHPANGAGRVKPRVGDLVCTRRRNQATTYAELAGLAQPPAGRALHCDLVTDVTADRIWVVGGNKQPAHGMVCPLNPSPDGCTAAEQAAGECGCTVNRVSHRLTTDGFLRNNPRWVAVVRLGP